MSEYDVTINAINDALHKRGQVLVVHKIGNDIVGLGLDHNHA